MLKSPLRLTIIAFAGLWLASCSSTPSGVIPPEKMAQLLADIFVGESVVDNNSRAFRSDSAKQVLLQSIYMRHGVTPEEVDSSFMWYGKNMEKYTDVYDRTIEILEERLEHVTLDSHSTTSTSSVSLEGDSVDVWPSVKYIRCTPGMPYEVIPFALSSDRHWERGDIYTLAFKVVGNDAPTTVTIAAEYYDGMTDYISTTERGQGWKNVTLVLDSLRSASSVFGTISHHVSDDGKEVAFIDSVTLYRTRWDSGSSSKRNGQKTVKVR